MGIEIGGSKLQRGVGKGDGTIIELEQFAVDPYRGADGILTNIARSGIRLCQQYQVAQARNQLAHDVISQAIETLGWAIAQVITLVAPDVVAPDVVVVGSLASFML